MVIYRITNLINGKIYIGQTTLTLNERIKSHIKTSKVKSRSNTPLYSGLKKYGIASFRFDQIDEADSLDNLNLKEIYWISKLNTLSPNGYNLRKGGQNGGKCSKELRTKISNAIKNAYLDPNVGRTGYFHSEETKTKISIALAGKNIAPKSEETRKRMSLAQKGIKKPKSLDWRENQRLKMTGRKNTEYTKLKRAKSKFKPVVCITTGREYESLKQAAKDNNVRRSNLSSLLSKSNGYLRNRISGIKLTFKFKQENT